MVNVKYRVIVMAALLLLAGGSAQAATFWLYATDFHSTNVLDEAIAQANAIDREAAGNAKSLAQFKTDVAAAFSQDLGGVCTWGDAEGYRNDAGIKQAGVGPGASGRGYNYFDSHGAYNGEKTKLLYGISQSKAVQMVPRRALEIWPHLSNPGNGTPVSGPDKWVDAGGVMHTDGGGAIVTPETNYWNGDPDSDNTRETLTFTPLAGGETVKELGMVLLSGSSAQNVDVWVDYADLTSSAIRTINIGAGSAADDVFVYFVAGDSPIVAVHWDSDLSRPGLGDLAVIMTPEPASISLLALAGLALIRRKNR